MGNDKALEKSKIHKVYDLINNRKNAMLQALPKHVTADRLINIVTNVVRVNPKLADCSELSLIGAIMMSVYTGLEPGVLGHCCLVPYGKDVQFIIEYKGYLRLVNNSGDVSVVTSEVVYENDFFEYELGLNEKLIHKPIYTNRGELTHVYTIATLKDGTKTFIVMDREAVIKIKDFALKNKKFPKDKNLPWNKWEPAMWKKTGIRQISKTLPLSIESQRLIAQDETVKSFDANYDNILSQPDETNYNEKQESKYDQDIQEGEVIEDEPDKKQETETGGKLFEQPENGTYQERLEDIMTAEFVNDPEGWKVFLKEHSAFTNKEGKEIPGKENINDLTVGRQKTTYGKIKTFLEKK